MVARAVDDALDASGRGEARVRGAAVLEFPDLQVLGLHMYGTRRAGVYLIAQDASARVRLGCADSGADKVRAHTLQLV